MAYVTVTVPPPAETETHGIVAVCIWCLQEVVSRVPLMTKANVRLVCQRWRNAVNDTVHDMHVSHAHDEQECCQLVTAAMKAFPRVSGVRVTFETPCRVRTGFERHDNASQSMGLCIGCHLCLYAGQCIGYIIRLYAGCIGVMLLLLTTCQVLDST